MRKIAMAVLFGCTLVLFSTTAFGQGSLGAITGTVMDSSGGVVPEATLTITNIETGLKVTAKSSSAGYFKVPVPPGTYKMETEKPGFKTEVSDNVVVPVAQVVTVDVTLQVGSQSQTVEVTATAPLLTPSTAEVSANITPQEFQTLPIALDDGGRQAQSFIFESLPGAVGDPYSGSINGGQLFSHNILIDGVTVGRYDMNGGAMDEYHPGTDAIGEFKVQMTNYSAEYGDTGGAIVNFSMKSGTNQFHGTGFEYNKNPVFNAAGLLVNANPGSVKNNEKENNFGGTIGGPIKKDKTFFFFSYEGDRFTNFSYGSATTIPTKEMRGGDFSSFLGAQVGTDALGRPVYTNEIFDPTTTRATTKGVADPVTGLTATKTSQVRDPFPGNIIPQGEFSKANSTLLPLFPNPMLDQDARNILRIAPSTPVLNRNAYNVKVDQVINDKQRISAMFGDYSRVLWKRNKSDSAYFPFPGQPITTYKNQDVIGPQARLTHSWVINDHSVNVATLAYNRTNNANNLTNNSKYTAAMGIPGDPTVCFPVTSFAQGVNKHVQFMSALGVGCANIDPSESYIGQDALSWTHGRHSIKIGGDFTRYRYDTDEPGQQSGSFQYSSSQTAQVGFTSTTGHPFASWLLGTTNTASRSVYEAEPGYRAGVLALFIQDDWKTTSKLTLNLGMRWELPLPKKEVFNRMSGFNATLPNPGADGIPGALEFLGNCSGCDGRTSFQNMYYKEFGPRLGLAYQIKNNVVFRAGYGISYGPPIVNGFGSQDINGFNSSVVVHRSGTPSSIDPVIFLTPLTSAALPPWAKVGLPAFTGTLPNRDPAGFNGNSVDYLPRTSLAQPYVQNWSAGFQYQLPHEVMIEANYVGSKGTRLLEGGFIGSFDTFPGKYMVLGDALDEDMACAIDPTCDAPTAATLAGFGITKLPYPDFESNNWDTTLATGLLPYPQYTGVTNNYPTMGSSTYNALQITARKNSTHGLTFIAAYTFSNTLTNTDSALYGYAGYGQDFYNRKLEKGIAGFDHPQSLKLTWIYSLPIGRGQRWLNSGGIADRLFSGWQITAIQDYLSGDPLAISSSLTTYTNQAGDPIATGTLRGDVISGVPQTVAHTGLDVINGTPYLNPAAFADPPASPGNNYPLRVGTAPRYLPQTRGPFQSNEDFGIIKTTRIKERFNAEIRCDMINVLNRTGLGDPDTSLGDGLPSQGGTFGLITAPAHTTGRVVQFAVRVNF